MEHAIPFPAPEYSCLQGQHCLFLAVFLVMKASWLNLLHIESVSHVRERGDFIGSESHCEFIITGKEQNVINEILNWLKKKILCRENESSAIRFGEQNQAEQRY